MIPNEDQEVFGGITYDDLSPEGRMAYDLLESTQSDLLDPGPKMLNRALRMEGEVFKRGDNYFARARHERVLGDFRDAMRFVFADHAGFYGFDFLCGSLGMDCDLIRWGISVRLREVYPDGVEQYLGVDKAA